MLLLLFALFLLSACAVPAACIMSALECVHHDRIRVVGAKISALKCIYIHYDTRISYNNGPVQELVLVLPSTNYSVYHYCAAVPVVTRLRRLLLLVLYTPAAVSIFKSWDYAQRPSKCTRTTREARRNSSVVLIEGEAWRFMSILYSQYTHTHTERELRYYVISALL